MKSKMLKMGKPNLTELKRSTAIQVDSLRRGLVDTEWGNTIIPGAMKFLFSEYPQNKEGLKYRWQAFILHNGKEVRHESFVSFVTTSPPEGLGSTIGKLEVWMKEKMPKYRKAFKDSKIPVIAKQGRPNKDKENPDNIRFNSYGTSESYTIARLKRDDPALARRVINGEISANEAAIQAGIRKKYVSVQATPEAFAKKARQIFNDAQLDEIVNLILQR
jgi:hypothetical protein